MRKYTLPLLIVLVLLVGCSNNTNLSDGNNEPLDSVSLMDKLVSDGHPKYGDTYESFKSFYGKDKGKYFLSGLLYADYYNDKPIHDLQIYFQNNNISISVNEAFKLAYKFVPDEFYEKYELAREEILQSSSDDKDINFLKYYYGKNKKEYLPSIHIYVETKDDIVSMLRMSLSTPRYFENYKRINKGYKN